MGGSWFDDWRAETGQNPPPVAVTVLHNMKEARDGWQPTPYRNDAYHHRLWLRKQQAHRDNAVTGAERDVCRAVERALDSGVTWSSEVADAVAAVRVARAWAPCGRFDAEDIDAFLASGLGLDGFLDARVGL